MLKPTYKITYNFELNCYQLYSYVKTNFGGQAKNFVCEGSESYCQKIKFQLEKGK